MSSEAGHGKRSDKPPRKRLFVGTFLSAQQQEKLGRLKANEERLSDLWKCKTKLVHGNKMHLTWLFLGYVPDDEIESIKHQLSGAAARHNPFTISYSHWEFWPSIKHARLWILAPDTVADPVQSLAEDVQSALGQFVAKPEERAYKPHITLARMDPVRSPKEIPEWLTLPGILPIRHDIDRIDLIESQPGKGAEAYHCLASFPLKKRG